MSCIRRKTVFEISEQVLHKPAVQPQKMAIGMKFQIYEVEEFYYLCSGNKGADQLRNFHTADLRLCFGIYAKNRFSFDAAHIITLKFEQRLQQSVTVIILSFQSQGLGEHSKPRSDCSSDQGQHCSLSHIHLLPYKEHVC